MFKFIYSPSIATLKFTVLMKNPVDECILITIIFIYQLRYLTSKTPYLAIDGRAPGKEASICCLCAFCSEMLYL